VPHIIREISPRLTEEQPVDTPTKNDATHTPGPDAVECLRGIIQAIERGEIMVCDMNSRPQQEATAYLLNEARAAIAKATEGAKA
jgi:hypothetical protein